MRSVKSAALAALAAASLSACASTVKPARGYGRVDDPRINNPNHLACLRGLGLPVQEVGRTGIQIGTPPSGPTVQFEPTPGAAQYIGIAGQAQGAEVIGAALLYPHQAGSHELTGIESCLAQGVSG